MSQFLPCDTWSRRAFWARFLLITQCKVCYLLVWISMSRKEDNISVCFSCGCVRSHRKFAGLVQLIFVLRVLEPQSLPRILQSAWRGLRGSSREASTSQLSAWNQSSYGLWLKEPSSKFTVMGLHPFFCWLKIILLLSFDLFPFVVKSPSTSI